MPIPSPREEAWEEWVCLQEQKTRTGCSAVGPSLSAHGSLATPTTAREKGHSSHIHEGAQPEAVRL